MLLYVAIGFHSSILDETLPQIAGITAAVAAILLVLTWSSAKLSLPRGRGLVLLAGLALSWSISTLGSADLAASTSRLLLYVAVVLLAVAIYLLYRDSERLPVAAYCLAIALALTPYVAEVIAQLAVEEGMFPADWPDVANFAHARHFGHICFLGAMTGAALVVFSARHVVPSFLLACCALFGMIAIGSRGPLLAWIIFIGLLSWLGPSRRRIALLGVAALAASSLLVWSLHSSGLMVTPNVFVRLQETVETGSGADSGRIQMWLASARQFAVHPLFGHGPEGYALSGCCDVTVSHPHNVVLQLLLEFGGAGCVLLLLLLLHAVKRLGGARRIRLGMQGSPEVAVLAAALLAYLALGLIDGMFYFAVPLLHFGLFSGLFAAGLHQAGRVAARGA